MSKRHRQVLPGPVITTPPGAVPPVILSSQPLVPQPLQFPLQPAQYPTYYEVPMSYSESRDGRFFPVAPPLFPPVYGPVPPLFPPVPPPVFPFPQPPYVFPIVF